MSMRENIQIHHQFDVDTYIDILKENGAVEHPAQEGAFIIEEDPFYAPRQIDEHVSILSFNYFPLPMVLLHALINYPELVPDDVEIIWLVEQDSFIETTMGIIRETQGENDT